MKSLVVKLSRYVANHCYGLIKSDIWGYLLFVSDILNVVLITQNSLFIDHLIQFLVKLVELLQRR